MYNKETIKGGEYVNIGIKIKEARQAKKLTQEELGKILGVQKSAIAKYESGRVVNIKRSTLKKISDVLDIRPSELIFEEEYGYTPENLADFTTAILKNSELKKMIEDFMTLEKSEKELVKNLIEKLKKD